MKASNTKKSYFDEGSLDQYLKEISNYPLIPREDEVELAQRIKQGCQKALDKLVRSNLRFVVSVAKKYQNQGVSLADLINEGNLGLIRAAHKFDETKGIKFISYAVWWIRQAILQALAEQSRGSCGCRSTAPARCTASASAPPRCSRSWGASRRRPRSPRGWTSSMEEVQQDPLHLPEPPLARRAAHAGRGQPAARLPARHPEPPARRETLRARAHASRSRRSLSTLKEREAKILRLYFGLDGPEPMTLEEIGRLLGITRERVRQIKEKALSRLRHVSRSRALQSFLN